MKMFTRKPESGLVNEIVDIYGIPTWISHIHAKDKKNNEIVLVIPGNPGPIGFYETFIESLYRTSNSSVTIYGISHAGHHLIPCECDGSYDIEKSIGIRCKDFYMKNHAKLYSLHDQIDHKLAFIYNFLPPDSKLILIGHSVGAYMILEIMRRLQPTKRVIKILLLFPTIERITKTSSGRFWTAVAYYMTRPLLWIIWLFNALPSRFQFSFIRCCVKLRRFCSDGNLPEAIFSFINHHGFSNMLQIVDDMKHIKDLDHETVFEENKDKIVLYYGKVDPWVPASFCQQMIERFPSMDVRLCSENHKHAFVLYTADGVGKLAWNLIKDSVTSSTELGKIIL